MTGSSSSEPLTKYRKKRDFAKTAEPEGRIAKAGGNRFVVQKHAASRLHYDLRLELDGVLKSWAVTRGPSINPDDKHLDAVYARASTIGSRLPPVCYSERLSSAARSEKHMGGETLECVCVRTTSDLCCRNDKPCPAHSVYMDLFLRVCRSLQLHG